MAERLAERIEELRRDRRHGGSWMARQALEGLLDVAAAAPDAELLERSIEAGRRLAGSRPEIGAIAGAVGRVLAAAHAQRHLAPHELRHLIREEAGALLAGRRRACASIAIQLRERLDGAVVVTHSASDTVKEALAQASPKSVICTITRPHEEGRTFAEELRTAGVPVELVEDDEAPSVFSHGSLLLVGADTVFRDGTLRNKIGTRRLAEAAAKVGAPTLVASELLKLAPLDAGEAPELTPADWELVDLTPPELIERVVTEEGAFGTDELPALVDRTPFLREGYALLRAGV